MKLKGNAIILGDDVNTDGIIAGRYLHLTNPADLADHAMEDMYPDFKNKFKKNDIIVAGKNFGCGSSREQAAICLRYKGAKAIIAVSFARIFFRNAINQGILPIQSPQAIKEISDYDQIEIETKKGIIYNQTKKNKFFFTPLPQFMQEIIKNDGLLSYIQQRKK